MSESLTLDEQIGQSLMVGFHGMTPSPEVLDLIQRHHVGSVLLFSRNIRDAGQVLELTTSLQAAARDAGHRYPLLIAIDQENGIVQRLGDAATIFPGNMALGATRSEELAFRVAQATGSELRALGINFNLAPVVDVNNNPANPVIGVRSFGEDAQLVARMGAAMVRGYRAAGVISCLKHFPGHGDTAVDSHLALPTIQHSLDRLDTVELVPFRSGMQAGAESVMIAHVVFPSLEQDSLPATLSPAIVQDLLRQRLGFEGVILSDCLEMSAISETFGVEPASVMALQAGIDLVLVSHHYDLQRGSIEAIHEAVRTHRLSGEVLAQAAARVQRLKARSLSWDTLPAAREPSPIIGSQVHRQLQNEAYARSITLVRNAERLVPLQLKPEQRLIVLALPRHTATLVEDRYYHDDLLLNILRQYHPNTHIQDVPAGLNAGQFAQAANAENTYITATVNAHLDEQQTGPVRALVQAGRRIIGLALRDPYDLQAFPQLRTYIACYEYTAPALQAAARVLFGKAQASGQLPVSLPGIYYF
jgi:beta-N-acetylhexosaminidase